MNSINKISIIITNNAWKKMSEIVYSCKSKFLFSATSGGCNGFNYDLKLINNIEYDKLLNENKYPPSIIKNNGVKLVIDPYSEMLLLGTTIDYISEDYTKGIFESKFIYIPDKKLANTCGCGVSFTLK